MDVAPPAEFQQRLAVELDRPDSIARCERSSSVETTLDGLVSQSVRRSARECPREMEGAFTRTPDSVMLLNRSEEQLRQVLYGPDSPATMSGFDSIDCYHLDEHTRMRNLAGKVEELSIATENAAARAMVVRQRAKATRPVVFRRGRPDLPGRAVPLQVPAVFTSSSGTPTPADRSALAKAIGSPANPLTARVFVNRVWHWHFGQPLVTTVSDFGLRSTLPSHPELLDFLASWFIENGWSVKKLHRLIMTSSTYAQSSVSRSEARTADPTNRLLWRFNARRLEWEAIRDGLLAVSGRLERRSGGRPQESAPDAPDSVCRTIYLHVDRQEISKFAHTSISLLLISRAHSAPSLSYHNNNSSS